MKKRWILALPLLLAGAGILWQLASGGDSGPSYRWLLSGGAGAETNFAEAAVDAPVELEVELPHAAHVYVASHNPTDGTIALFPTPWLETDAVNPLPSGTHRLPGRHGDDALSWPVRPTVGATDYLLVVSPEPIAELDALFATVRQASNSTFPDHRMVITAPRGRSMDDVPPRTRLPGEILPAAARIVEETLTGTLRHWSGDPQVLLGSMKLLVKDAASPTGR